MQLQAVFLPPPELVDGALAAAQAIEIAPAEPTAPPPTGISKLFKKSPQIPPLPELGRLPIVSPALRVLRFGNVTNEDAQNLADALLRESGSWPTPTFHVKGLHVEQTGTQFLAVADLAGETDLAWTIFRSVNEVARTQRFFLDRRTFNPEFSVASLTIGGEPNPAALQTIPSFSLGSAENYTGPEWHASQFALVRVPYAPGAPLEIVADVPLGANA